ncbi:hypothetical protein [Bartonella tamiae]|uniref:Outer membrane lipoprotein omp10 n=1 Tax=Bartonella tamiae Th239 TaxID=1094558 RepID=J1JZA7_9HYPH|nr:hypothetical protein [Bartonella tamiae]EJF90437.1 hypothetical protein ME5_00838 [Bartonella tamiae Th239]EJF93619.1 hypothetical protein MEG_01043 [Bartonella tamiae Th307]
MKRYVLITYCTFVSFLLAACSLSQNYGQNPVVQNVPQGIAGQWVDSNGIVSSFHNNVFETRAADTNEKLSEGNYIFRNPQLVEIEMRSIIRGTVSRVNCALSNNAMQLLCTTSNGAQFALNRKV